MIAHSLLQWTCQFCSVHLYWHIHSSPNVLTNIGLEKANGSASHARNQWVYLVTGVSGLFQNLPMDKLHMCTKISIGTELKNKHAVIPALYYK